MPERLLRRHEVEVLTGLGRSTIYAMIARRTFPAPLRVGARAVRWPESVVHAWIAARPSARSARG